MGLQLFRSLHSKCHGALCVSPSLPFVMLWVKSRLSERKIKSDSQEVAHVRERAEFGLLGLLCLIPQLAKHKH